MRPARARQTAAVATAPMHKARAAAGPRETPIRDRDFIKPVRKVVFPVNGLRAGRRPRGHEEVRHRERGRPDAEHLAQLRPGVGGEIQLTDGIASLLQELPAYAHRFEGTRFDCGSKQGFLDATVHFARKRGFKIN